MSCACWCCVGVTYASCVHSGRLPLRLCRLSFLLPLRAKIGHRHRRLPARLCRLFALLPSRSRSGPCQSMIRTLQLSRLGTAGAVGGCPALASTVRSVTCRVPVRVLPTELPAPILPTDVLRLPEARLLVTRLSLLLSRPLSRGCLVCLVRCRRNLVSSGPRVLLPAASLASVASGICRLLPLVLCRSSLVPRGP